MVGVAIMYKQSVTLPVCYRLQGSDIPKMWAMLNNALCGPYKLQHKVRKEIKAKYTHKIGGGLRFSAAYLQIRSPSPNGDQVSYLHQRSKGFFRISTTEVLRKDFSM